MTQLDLIESHPPPGKGKAQTYTAEQIFREAKAVRLAAKFTGEKLSAEIFDCIGGSLGCPNLNRITNRDVALFLPYLPGLRCRNLRDAVKAVSMKRVTRANNSFQPRPILHPGWFSIPDKIKDRIAQAIWERKGRPVPCEGITEVHWGIGYETYLGCRAYLGPTGRLFTAFEPPLERVDWEEYMKFKPEGTEVGV
mgnify:CR=1 FL=1